MAEKTTIARPYALAVFNIARDRDELARWSEILKLLAAIIADKRVGNIIGDPRVAKELLAEFIVGVGGDRFGSEAKNLIRLLIENNRLNVIGEAVTLYEGYRADAERTMAAEVVASFPLSEVQRQQIAAALKRRLGREVTLICKVDKNLLGGAVIRAGDLVIDGSVTGQLAKLHTALSR